MSVNSVMSNVCAAVESWGWMFGCVELSSEISQWPRAQTPTTFTLVAYGGRFAEIQSNPVQTFSSIPNLHRALDVVSPFSINPLSYEELVRFHTADLARLQTVTHDCISFIYTTIYIRFYWLERVRNMLSSEIFIDNRLSRELSQLILSLPPRQAHSKFCGPAHF